MAEPELDLVERVKRLEALVSSLMLEIEVLSSNMASLKADVNSLKARTRNERKNP